MASLRDIRKRIKSVKNTQKITKAMKMVSAAKLRRAQERVLAARPFADKIAQTTAAVAKTRRADRRGAAPRSSYARPESKKGGKIEIVAITSDRGLCGAFNSNVVRKALRTRFDCATRTKRSASRPSARKAAEGMKRERVDVRKSHEKGFETQLPKAQAIALELADQYKNGQIDGAYIVYNEFVNAAAQRVIVDQVLPIKPVELKAGEVLTDYEYEPSQTEPLDACCRANSPPGSIERCSRRRPPNMRRA